MDKATLRKVQLVQLEIAKEIKRVCEENGIGYWLDSGTMLGAVRHKGFIPWDDDLDMGMFREDYERFLHIAPKALHPPFALQQWETDPHYGLAFAKVRKAGTLYIENKSQRSQSQNGIFVDIFPYDHYGNDPRGQGLPLRVINTIMRRKSGMQTWREGASVNWRRFIGQIPFAIVAPFASRAALTARYKRVATMYNERECEYYFPQGISNYGRWIIPVSAMTEMIDAPFEDDVFKIPRGYDAYLTHAYGDYMTLPPEDKRGNRHEILEVRF